MRARMSIQRQFTLAAPGRSLSSWQRMKPAGMWPGLMQARDMVLNRAHSSGQGHLMTRLRTF